MKGTKKTLLVSILSLVLCVAMLLGTTYAWFTDSVQSGVNTIVAGNLDVELYHQNKNVTQATKVTSTTNDLFKDVAKWEPGAYAYETFTVKNEGNLALKYKMALNVSNFTSYNGHNLTEVLKVAELESVPESRDAITNGTPLKDWQLNAADTPLVAGASKTFTVAIYWEPGENDNDFNMNNGRPQPLSIEFGVNLVATQYTSESDSFGTDYDANASNTLANVKKYEIKLAAATKEETVAETGITTIEVNATPTTSTEEDRQETKVEFPEGALTAGQKANLEVNTTNSLFNVTATGAKVASIDLNLTVNGEKVTSFNGKTVTVTTYISAGLDNVQVSYNGVGDAPKNVNYEKETGKLVFETNHFSEYDVNGSAVAFALGETDSGFTTYTEAAKAAKEETNENVVIAKGADLEQAVAEAKKEGAAFEIPDEVIEEYVEKNPGKKEVVEEFAACVDGKYFSSFGEALQAAKDGDTVKLTGDITNNTTNTINKSITVDLGSSVISGSKGYVVAEGKEVKFTATTGGLDISGTDPVFKVNKGASLTVTGAKITSAGTAISIANTKTEVPMKVTINEGTSITAPTIMSLDALNGYSGAKVEINGGKFVATANGSYVRPMNLGGANVTINGGTFEAPNSTSYCYFIDVSEKYNTETKTYDVGNVTINGGTFKSNANYGRVVYGSIGDYPNRVPGNVIINNGRFEMTNTYGVITDIGAHVVVNDCTFIGGGRNVFSIGSNNTTDRTIEVNGGSYTISPSMSTWNIPLGSFAGSYPTDTAPVGKVILKGGTINSYICDGSKIDGSNSVDLVAEGYHVVDNGNGTKSVVADN